MGNTLQPPKNLLGTGGYFIVLYDKVSGEFTLYLMDRSTYNLGNGAEAKEYFNRSLNAELGDMALDTAENFLGSLVIPKNRRVISIDVIPNKTDTEILFMDQRDNILSDYIIKEATRL